MIPFHSFFPELAQREVRCVHIGPAPDSVAESHLPSDEYIYLEFYCDDIECDCRRVFLQVIAKNQPDKVFASINYGWEDEAFYGKRLGWNPTNARNIVRGELDPINAQSELAAEFLDLFKRVVLDEPYRLRLRRHYQCSPKERMPIMDPTNRPLPVR